MLSDYIEAISLRARAMGSWASLRQFTFPPEFRIRPPVRLHDELDLLEKIGRALEQDSAASASVVTANQLDQAEQYKLYVEIGTRAWRIRRRIVDQQTAQPNDNLKQPLRHVEAIIAALGETGVSIKDHTGEKWVDGQTIDVVAFQPTAGLSRETIIETMKPSIFFNARHLQVAQVIVGVPATPEGGRTPSTHS